MLVWEGLVRASATNKNQINIYNIESLGWEGPGEHDRHSAHAYLVYSRGGSFFLSMFLFLNSPWSRPHCPLSLVAVASSSCRRARIDTFTRGRIPGSDTLTSVWYACDIRDIRGIHV